MCVLAPAYTDLAMTSHSLSLQPSVRCLTSFDGAMQHINLLPALVLMQRFRMSEDAYL